MTIFSVDELAPQLRITDSTLCPRWCVIHVPGDHVLHVGDDVTMDLILDGQKLHLSEEQGEHSVRGLEPAAIRLQGAGDAPMTPDEALHLAGLLILAARRTVSQ